MRIVKNDGRGKGFKQFVAVPLQLKTVVIPKLINKLGGWKHKIVTHQMLLNYLNKHRIMFDRQVLREMFQEADFQNNGSLNEAMLFNTISGTFPKRKYTHKWLDLLQLILQEPKELLDSSMKIGGEALLDYKETRGPHKGTFNSDNLWDAQIPSKINQTQTNKNLKTYIQRTYSLTKMTKEQTKLNNSQLSKQFSTLNYVLSDEIPLRTTHGIKSLQQIDDEFTINELIYRNVADRVGERPQSTFKSTNWFENFDEGLKLNHSLASDIKRDLKYSNNTQQEKYLARPSTCPASMQRKTTTHRQEENIEFDGDQKSSCSINNDNTKNSFENSKNTLNKDINNSISDNDVDNSYSKQIDSQNYFQDGNSFIQSTDDKLDTRHTYNVKTNWQEFAKSGTIKQRVSSPLQNLRASVNSIVPKKPFFDIYHRPLTPCDLTFKKVLGQQQDLNGEFSSMNRVFPVRGKVLNSDDYQKWADIASRCPTNPERWDAYHPSIAVQF